MKSNQIDHILGRRMPVSILVFAGLLLSGAAAQAQNRTCSNTDLAGAYGSTIGMLVLPAGTPRSILLRFEFDGNGNFANTLTVNDNGTVVHTTDSGTYTINPDCTGTLYTNEGTRTVEILLVDGGNEFYSIRTDPANLVFLFNSAKKIFPGDSQAHAQSK